MVKKKTSVVLPKGIAGLVRDAQTGGGATAAKESVQPKADEPIPTPIKEEPKEVAAEAPKRDVKPAKTASQKAARDYTIVKDQGADSWDLFIDMAKDYKSRDSRLATVYIDSDLKKVLDRLKTASDVKLPTTAILSSIVARFIFDHEEKIKSVIYGEKLL